MADESLEELTPEERALFQRAEEEACRGLSFDFEAGLADLRARARRRKSPALPRQRSGSASVAWLRIGAVAAVMAALGTATGFRLMAPGYVGEAANPPAFWAPTPATSAIATPTPAPTPAMSAHPRSPALATAIQDPRGKEPSGKPSKHQAPSREPRATSHRPAAPVTPPVTEPSATPTPSPSATIPMSFRVRYPATWLTLPLDDTDPQTIDLAEPKIVDDGPIRFTAAPTGDLLMDNTTGVLAATVQRDHVTPADCAAAIQGTTNDAYPMALLDDRTYCLMTTPATPGSEEPQTLVRVDVEHPEDNGEVKLRLAGWDTVP